VNYASGVAGAQVGVVNIADSFKGFPIGLVSLSQDGERHFDYWLGPDGIHRVGFRFGTRLTYTMFTGGYNPGGADSTLVDELWSVGVGGGIHIPLDFLFVNVDASIRRLQSTAYPWLDRAGSQVLAEGRAVVGLGWDRIGAFAGVQLQAYFPELSDQQYLGDAGALYLAPGLIAGVYL
jgi:hypothetical protein